MKKHKKCSNCGAYTPAYLLSMEWLEELEMMLNRAENEHIWTDAKGMLNLELFQLFEFLKNKQKAA